MGQGEQGVEGKSAAYNLLVVLGPTASGKTRLAVSLARRLNGEILSADSRQIYRGMDLGTGKDLAEYRQGGRPVPHHLIDILDPQEAFSVFAFQQRFFALFAEIRSRGRLPLLAGGTGLYLDAVLRQYDLPEVPEDPGLRERLSGEGMDRLRQRLKALGFPLHNRTDLDDRSRLIRAIEIAAFKQAHPARMRPPVPLQPLVLGVRLPRAELHRRIGERLAARLQAGLVEEVRRLQEEGLSWERLDAFGLEYRYVGRHLRGELTWEAMVETLAARIRQFANRQETWFRGMEKKGVRIHWVDPGQEEERIGTLVG
jgi:tRNA dimethylallyltransferase